jgi:N-glycosylase/DNA lyase
MSASSGTSSIGQLSGKNMPPSCAPEPPPDTFLWSPWRELEPEIELSFADLAETLDGGQAFRWKLCSIITPGTEEEFQSVACFQGVVGSFHLRISLSYGYVCWSRALQSEPFTDSEEQEADAAAEKVLVDYLAAKTDFAALADQLPWRGDPILAAGRALFPGLRLLRQPWDETLLAFLLSSNKQIVQIKQCLETLAENFGEPLPCGGLSLPKWERLAECTLEALKACRLGYRAAYVLNCARILSEKPEFLTQIDQAPTEEARHLLRSLPGVGPKVADCILLFAGARYDVFPMDVWIARCLEEDYGLQGWSTQQLRTFAAIHFAPAPGLAQQFLFAQMRARHAKSLRSSSVSP